jgi:signal transduction histidine kinase
LIICSSMLVSMVAGVLLWYLLGYRLLRDTIRDSRIKTAELLSANIADAVKDEVDKVKMYSYNPSWHALIEQNNLKYLNMDSKARQDYLLGMDKKWLEADGGGYLTKEYLENPVSVSLNKLLRDESEIEGIFVTDKYGGLVAASDKVGDFDRADEYWWQKAFGGGSGSIFVGDVELNKLSGTFGIPIAIPIKNEAGDVIGVCKAVISINIFFDRLKTFTTSNTAHAVLVNANNIMMFHPGVAPMSTKFADDKSIRRLAESKERYGIVSNPTVHKYKIFLVSAAVESQLLKANGIHWRVLIDQDVKEVFAPLRKSTYQLLIAMALLISSAIPLGFIIGGEFARPIEELNAATEKIRKGGWDYKIQVRTGDEIEQFAESFREMVITIQTKQSELMRAKEELEELSKTLESRVDERTEELSAAMEDLNEAKDRLEMALKVKSDFVSMVSHELRTPLTAIKEGINIVLGGSAGAINEEQKDFLDTARRNVDRLVRLINDILDFQKLEYSRTDFKVRENDMNEVIRDIQKTMSPLAFEKGLSFNVELDESLPKIWSDRDKIIQVLTNIVSNAIKFTEKGGVTIISSLGPHYIQIIVQDTGIGIKAEDLSRLFKEFEQLKQGIDRKGGGTGLGLSISKRIVEGHKGRIWVESKFGEGTSFYIILPIKEQLV